ncbi:Mur ligase family protein [Aliiglaciecola sp. M165]|uniref:Mur ligase family protein n=1 Tax=Aliiglaciecola sp. M165 TaxID=2593649 RepID=UPI0011816CF7|nr:Mur ligase family protein [Aliiglaciecola sp. M165]TRY33378.1 Mur ligase [Aliiglaciecola sp. M165]
MRLELDEVRRLTGPNLLWDEPGAILDVFIDEADTVEVVKTWQKWMDKLLSEFGWQESHTYRLYTGGASMALSAPMDALYTACDLAELAWDCTVSELTSSAQIDWQSRLKDLTAALREEQNATLLSLLSEAKTHGVSAISDDDEFSLGMGPSVEVWPVDKLPDPHDIKWSAYKDIPRAFITGTNGKSTSVRLASEIAKAAGYCAGVTSTDFIKVGDEVIDTGDYSGPGGARMLLRNPRTEMAFLEVARGGILRRGLPIEKVDAALVTNVASDHLGQYGINTVDELAQVKFVVAKGLNDTGTLVTNADNELTKYYAQNLHCDICWFSEHANSPQIQHNLQVGKPVVFVRDQQFIFVDNKGVETNILSVNDVPMTMNGAARHNVQNALGVIGLCMAMGLSLEAIRQGLKSFGSDASDNPGRGNVYTYNGANVLVDFAHNAHSVKAMIETAKHMHANRYLVMFSNAGDRGDEEIHELTDAIRDLDAHHYIVAEIDKYLRGREPKALLHLVEERLLANGVNPSQIHLTGTPVEGAKFALSQAKQGDVVILFTLDQREEVDKLLKSGGLN